MENYSLKQKTIDKITRFGKCWDTAYKDSIKWKEFSEKWSSSKVEVKDFDTYLGFVGDAVSIFNLHLKNDNLDEYTPAMSDQIHWAYKIMEGYLDFRKFFTKIRERIVESIAMVSEYEDSYSEIDACAVSFVSEDAQKSVKEYLSRLNISPKATNVYYIDGTTSTAIRNPCSAFIAKAASKEKSTYIHETFHANSDGFPNQTLNEGFTHLITFDAKLLESKESIDDIKSLEQFLSKTTEIYTDGIRIFFRSHPYDLVSAFALALTKVFGKEALVREYFRYGTGMNGQKKDW